jgi:hypothetical protein
VIPYEETKAVIRNNRRVAALAIGGALTIAPAVTGCGAGFSPQSTRPSEPPQGLNVQIPQNASKPAQIQIRNLFVLGPADNQQLAAGADAPVYADIIDAAGTPDQLRAVSSPSFSSPSSIAGNAINLPSHQLVSLNGGTKPLVVLKGLTQPLFGGENIPLTLTFQNAGSITVQVQVVPWSGIYATYPPAQAASPSPSATPSASASARTTASPGTSAGPAANKKKTKATESATPSATATP